MVPDFVEKSLIGNTSKSKIFSICQIRPYLFIAGYGALSHQKLKDLGITHAIDATNFSKTLRSPDIEYFEIKIDDNERADIKKYFNEAAAFIRTAKESGGKSLVFCGAGISRSATICIMYLAIEENMTIKDAYLEIENIRSMISPNLGFWRQMINYEIEKRGETSVKIILNDMKRQIPDVYLYKSTFLASKRRKRNLKMVFVIFVTIIVLYFACYFAKK